MGVRQLGGVPGRPRGRGRAAGAVAIRTVGLTRVFGSHKAVDSVNLEVRTGEVFGFLGPNGAGKTTTINMILGLIRPTAGHVEILGQKADWACPALRRHVGSLLDGMRFYPYLSGRDNLRVFAAALDGIPSRRIDEVLDLVGLAGRARDKVKGYSHGMQRRLELALALLHDPAVLVLDEPANGLDPAGIKEMRDLMKALAVQGKAVFLSSHLLHEVEIICDRVAILRRGVVLAQGRVDELLGAAPAVEIAVDRPDEAERILRSQAGVDAGMDGGSGRSNRSSRSSRSSRSNRSSRSGGGSGGARETVGECATPCVRSVRRDGDRIIVEYDPGRAEPPGSAAATGFAGRRGAIQAQGSAAYRTIASRLNATLAAHGVFAHEVLPRRAALEDVFFDVLGEAHGE
ncbi:MAG: ATP-binding cassette domain-containing protein [Firmicutes bacterium]|nr:ATP-binding cassette domain-containing protein [Bacillota bacterium]